jgi:hypothetical protein
MLRSEGNEMRDYYFELALTNVPDIPANTDYDAVLNEIDDKFYKLFGENGALGICNGEWSISVTMIEKSSLEAAITEAVRKVKTLGFGVSQILLEPSQIEHFNTPELLGA